MNNDVEFQAVCGDGGSLAINIENPVSASRASDLNRPETAVGIAVLIVAMMLTIFSISYALHGFVLDKPYHGLTKQDALKTTVSKSIRYSETVAAISY